MKNVAVLGIGASGVAAARLAHFKGANVHVSDLQTDAAAAARAADLRTLGIEVDLGHHPIDRIAAADVVVASPGIPPDAPVLRDLRARGRTWIAEPEFALRFHTGALIALTGTNGKTTASVLTAHLLRSAGAEVALGGNVGGGFAPAASVLPIESPDATVWVLEMSSFQLADVVDFRPDVGVVTNLAPDHLDRYPDVESYWADKSRLFRNADEKTSWVLNGDQPEVLALPGDAAGRRVAFSIERAPDAGPLEPGAVPVAGWIGGTTLRVDPVALGLKGTQPGPIDLLEVAELPLLGRHNVANALAAGLAALLAGASVEGVRAGLRTAEALPHRMEPVGEAAGVLWVNDSKATNVSATVSAVTSLSRPIVLLLGGKDKGESFAPLAAVLTGERIRAVFCFGAAGARLHRELGTVDGARERIRRIEGGLEAAVTATRTVARPGDVLLLSPACSSFDEFQNYEARGRRFRELFGEAA